MNAPSPAEKKAIGVLGLTGIVEAPVRIEQIARGLGVQITYLPFEGDISGMLFRDVGKAVIGVNSRHAATRQRFTIAHEIGHLEMHKGQPVFIDRFVRLNMRDGHSTPEETQANAFAAELLMPRSVVPDEIDRVLSKGAATSSELVSTLAQRFQVSSAAMQYRLINLGMLDPYTLAG